MARVETYSANSFEKMNILITSAGRRGYIIDYFKNVNGIGKVYASNSVYSIALQHADDYFITPLIYSDDYISAILQFCKSKNISIVLSLFDADLYILAKHKKMFENEGIRIIVSDEDFINTCNDKWKTYNFLSEIGVKTPKTFIKKAQVKSELRVGKSQFPIVIKPRWGCGSIGVHIAHDYDELDVLDKICRREIFDSYLKYESNMTPETPIVYQQYISGEEYKLNVINDLNGKYVKTFAIKKIAIRSGETDIGVTVSADMFESIGQWIAKNSNHIGILSVDCFVSNSTVYVIEFNCRICGIYPLLHLAGLNFTQQLVHWVKGKPTDKQLFAVKEGVTVVKDLSPTILGGNK